MNHYTFSSRARIITFILMGIGVVATVLGVIHMMDAGEYAHHLAENRFWSNVLINGLFFFTISLAATFFIAVQYAAEAAWGVVLKRIMEAVGAFIGIGALILMLVWLAGSLQWHHIYHWMDPETSDPASPHYDVLIHHKRPFLNLPFFWIRVVVFMGVYFLYYRIMRKRSIDEDKLGGTSFFFRNRALSAGFLVFFGFTSMVASWDWIMSIDVHWFSTIFGWYVFSGMWVSAITTMTLIAIYLKRKGHLEAVNENHLHDLGKWMFAISFLWTYLWFSQFMLIWYANIPEEVTYFQARIHDYKLIYFVMLMVNFALPMLLLIARDAKRNTGLLMGVGVVIFVFHWLDVYMMITPGAVFENGQIGFLEIGMALGFLGLFSFVVLRALSKVPLMVEQHPYLDESIHHQQ